MTDQKLTAVATAAPTPARHRRWPAACGARRVPLPRLPAPRPRPSTSPGGLIVRTRARTVGARTPETPRCVVVCRTPAPGI